MVSNTLLHAAVKLISLPLLVLAMALKSEDFFFAPGG